MNYWSLTFVGSEKYREKIKSMREGYGSRWFSVLDEFQTEVTEVLYPLSFLRFMFWLFKFFVFFSIFRLPKVSLSHNHRKVGKKFQFLQVVRNPLNRIHNHNHNLFHSQFQHQIQSLDKTRHSSLHVELK